MFWCLSAPKLNPMTELVLPTGQKNLLKWPKPLSIKINPSIQVVIRINSAIFAFAKMQSNLTELTYYS